MDNRKFRNRMEAAAILSAAMLVLTGCAIGGSLKQFNVSDTKFTVSTNDGWMTEINDDNTGFTLEKEGDEVEVQFIDKDSMDIDSLRTVYEQAAETGLFDDADFEMDDNGNAVLTLEYLIMELNDRREIGSSCRHQRHNNRGGSLGARLLNLAG